ncbi:MAG: D-alanyl-D-alanine carboxypeptidase [Hyphomicrobiales bacterium]|nr:D-alanyl-D-alanine carboxypeptidase [Hyphomicrobiales bacterium]
MTGSRTQRALAVLPWVVAGLVLSLTVAAWAGPNPRREGEFNTSAPTAILLDADSGTVLFERNADELVPPASLSKLMTAEVVFNELTHGRLSREREFLVSTHAWRTGGAPSRTSSMFAPINSRVSVEDLLRGMIIQSANDASIALAEGIARSEDKFAAMMTARAREIGLARATFGNATGLPHPRQLMTARELARLARHIIQTYPELYKLYSEREFTFNKIRQLNRNPLLALNIGADGLKTGFTREAGYGLVGSAVQNGLRLIVVINGLKSEKERADEARKLLEWGFNHFQSGTLFNEGQVIAHAKVYGSGSVPLVAVREVKLMVPRGARERVTARVTYTGPVRPPVQKGQAIGTLKVWRGEFMVLELPLQAAEAVSVGSVPRRALDAATEFVYALVRAGLQRL